MENNNLPTGTPQEAELNAVQPVNTENQPETTTEVSAQTPEPQPQNVPEAPVQSTASYSYSYGSAANVAPSVPQQAYNPYQQQASVPNTAYPYQAQVYTQTTNPNKKSGGKIVALVFGIILTIIGAFLTFCVTVYYMDVYNTYDAVSVEIPVYVTVLLPLIIGIILIVFGCKKKKIAAVNPSAVGVPNSYPTPLTYSPTLYAQPTVQPTVTPNPQPTTVQPSTATTANPAEAATPSDVAAQTQVGAATTNSVGTAPTTYQYAPTAPIQGNAKDILKKNARRSGLISIAISVCMWVLIFGLNFVVVGWITILPICLAYNSLKSNIKSVSGWIGMILSILTAILSVLVYFAF